MVVQLLWYVSVVVWRQGAAASLGLSAYVGDCVSVDRCQDKLTYIFVLVSKSVRSHGKVCLGDVVG